MNLKDPTTGKVHTVYLNAVDCTFSVDGGPVNQPRVPSQHGKFYELSEFERLIYVNLWDFEGRQRDVCGHFIAGGDYLYGK